MKMLKHPEHGFTNCGDGEVAEMEKIGWKVITEADHKALIAAKKKAWAVEPEVVVSEPTQGSQPIPVFVPEKRHYFKKQRDEG